MLRRIVSAVMMIGLLILARAIAILEEYTLKHIHYFLTPLLKALLLPASPFHRV